MSRSAPPAARDRCPLTLFHAFGPAHIAIGAAIPLVAVALAFAIREFPSRAPFVRLSLAWVLAIDALSWYAVSFTRGDVRPPHGLPLNLCDAVVWVTVYALVKERPWALETAYYLGLAGSGMALLTPDLGSNASTWDVAQFFIAHGLVIVAVLLLVLTRVVHPRPGAWWRAFLTANAYAAFVAAFDAIFERPSTCRKPQAGTLLICSGRGPSTSSRRSRSRSPCSSR